MRIRPFRPADEEAVVSLWEACGLTRPWNDPRKDIARKLSVQPELFLVGEYDESIVASVMGGYDGHRGWVNYLAVHPQYRRRGYGQAVMKYLEQRLLELGCPKVNLQVRASNDSALDFYRRIGYARDEVVGLGRRLVPDEPGPRE
jgi:ribosomal protein S18 acetylase RimI-like enzyme